MLFAYRNSTRDHLSIAIKLWNILKVSGPYYWEDGKLTVAASIVIPFFTLPSNPA